jgi:hypothetical protein
MENSEEDFKGTRSDYIEKRSGLPVRKGRNQKGTVVHPEADKRKGAGRHPGAPL